MDVKNAVAIYDVTLHSQLLEDAVVLVREVLAIDCPLVHVSQLNNYLEEATLFILPYFEGETYDKVKEHGIPVIGPAAFIRLLKEEILLPRRLKKGRNLFSLALHGACVCCSNIEISIRNGLYEKVEAMGGTISKALTADVTHLVVGEVGSTKYHFATQLGIPIVLTTWVDSIWSLSKNEVVKLDNTFTEKHKCPVFKGCTVCVTGLDLAQRSEVQRLVMDNGGVYSGDLMMDTCTHLLCDSTEGQKFAFAQKWKIPCVRLRWFYESIEKGYCLDIKDFRHAAKQDAPEDSRVCLEETRNVSVDDTALTKTLSSLDLLLNSDKDYLDGCKIYLHGFTATEQELLKKLVNNGSGIRLDVASPRVSHVVSNAADKREIASLLEEMPEVFIINAQWLIDSMTKGFKQDERKYLLTLSKADKSVLTSATVEAESNTEELLQQYRNEQKTVTEDLTAVDNTIIRSHDTTKVDTKLKIFSGHVFFISDNIEQKLSRNLRHQIVANGGECVKVPSTYCVVDAFKTPPDNCSNGTVVTYMWVQRCIQEKTLLDISSCTVFKPHPVPPDCRVLEKCIVSYTQFQGYTLVHINKIVEKLGGMCQGTFTNKLISNHKKYADAFPCTHLIYKTQDSKKYASAIGWKIPAVTIDWLYSCLENLAKVSATQYQCRYDIAKVKKEKMKSLAKVQNILREVVETGDTLSLDRDKNLFVTDKDGFVTPVKPHSNLQTERVISALESPACTSMDLEKSITSLYKKNITNAMKKTAPVNKTLSGVTIVIKLSKQTDVNVNEVKNAARRNGAIVKSVIDRSCTHIVCGLREGKDANIEKAVKQGVKLVSPHWVLCCDASQTKLPEIEYPAGYNPNRCLNISISNNTTIEPVDITNPEYEVAGKSDPVVRPGNDTNVCEKEEQSPNKEKKYNNTADTYSLDEDLRKDISIMEKLVSEPESKSSFATPNTPKSLRKNKRSTLERRRNQQTDLAATNFLNSQPPLTITYDDGSEARAAFYAAQPNKISDDTLNNSRIPNMKNLNPSSSSTPSKSSEEKPEKPVTPVSQQVKVSLDDPLEGIDPDDLSVSNLSDEAQQSVAAQPREYKFLLTGMLGEEKDTYQDIITTLKGVLLQSQGYDTSCTHLVVSKPNRNEKYLAALGAGIWLLHPSYLSHSHEHGAFLDEKDFLWSNFTANLRGVSKLLASASSLWIGKKAFTNWDVMFFVSSSRVASFKGIIEAGGGKVSQWKPPYSVQRSITHALFEGHSYNKPEVPLSALQEAGIPCLKLEYLPEYLMSRDETASFSKYLIEPHRSQSKRVLEDVESDHDDHPKRYKT